MINERKVGMKRLCLSKKTYSLFFGALLFLAIFPCFAMKEGKGGGCLGRLKARAQRVQENLELESLMCQKDEEKGGSKNAGSSLACRNGAKICTLVVAGLVVTAVSVGITGLDYFNPPSTPPVPPSKGTGQTPMMNLTSQTPVMNFNPNVVAGLNANGTSAHVGIVEITPGNMWSHARAQKGIPFWNEWGNWEPSICNFFDEYHPHHGGDWCKEVQSMPQTFEWTIPGDDENNTLAVGHYDPTKDDCQPRCVIRYKPGQRTGLFRGLPPSSCRTQHDCREYMWDLVAQCAIDSLDDVACTRKGKITKAAQKLQTKRELRNRYPRREKRARGNRPGKNGR